MLALALAITLQPGPVDLYVSDVAITIPEGCRGAVLQGIDDLAGTILCGRLEISVISYGCDPCGLDEGNAQCRSGKFKEAAFFKTEMGIPGGCPARC